MKYINKIIAPVVITILFVLLELGYWALYFKTDISDMGFLGSFIINAIFVCCISTSVYVFIQRIKEINGGEEDDLSKY